MILLTATLNAWGTSGFEGILKGEVEQLDTELLPLQQGLSTSSHVTESPRKAMIIRVSDDEGFIRVKAGILYSGIIAGCSCADDPTPVDEQNEYCEVQIEINNEDGRGDGSAAGGINRKAHLLQTLCACLSVRENGGSSVGSPNYTDTQIDT